MNAADGGIESRNFRNKDDHCYKDITGARLSGSNVATTVLKCMKQMARLGSAITIKIKSHGIQQSKSSMYQNI
jgi:hypothetical protein